MKNYTLTIGLLIFFSFLSRLQAQRPDLGTLTHFVLFTSAGTVGNTGISDITGDLGTNVGVITGFGTVTGNQYIADATTAQAEADVISAYDQLLGTPATVTTHPPDFGGGETLFAGVYSIAGAASVFGSLTLDAQGDPNAIFIFKAGGAITTEASTVIHLINSATARNIFWIADGAISMAISTTISGTFIANNGAVDMGDGSFLEGRLLSTGGAVSVYGTRAFIPAGAVLSLNGLSLTGNCEGVHIRLAWAAMDSDTKYITVQGSRDGLHWMGLKKIVEGEKTWFQQTISLTDQSPVPSLYFYRLEVENLTGEKEYGAIIRIPPCALKNNNQLTIYPNPSTGVFHLKFEGGSNRSYSTALMNVYGKMVYSSAGIPLSINMSKLPAGVYIVRVQSTTWQGFYSLLKL